MSKRKRSQLEDGVAGSTEDLSQEELQAEIDTPFEEDVEQAAPPEGTFSEVVDWAEEREPTIPFPSWFLKQVQKGRLRDHQEEALLVFFKKRGLSAVESPAAYEEAFLKF